MTKTLLDSAKVWSPYQICSSRFEPLGKIVKKSSFLIEGSRPRDQTQDSRQTFLRCTPWKWIHSWFKPNSGPDSEPKPAPDGVQYFFFYKDILVWGVNPDGLPRRNYKWWTTFKKIQWNGLVLHRGILHPRQIIVLNLNVGLCVGVKKLGPLMTFHDWQANK